MKTILIVEDDRVYARTIANWLAKNGMNARYVLSVGAAKEFIAGCETDLVLSDFRLPDGNGVELLEWMKAGGYRKPFLIMTSYGEIPGAVAATNEDLEKAITEGRFREDLFHRLNEFPLYVPLLAECPEDIIPLAEFMLKATNRKLKKDVKGFDRETLKD